MTVHIFWSTLLSIVTISAGWVVVTTLRLGVPPMPSSRKLRDAVVAALSDLPADSRVVDVGAGWGGLVRRITRERPDLAVEGLEHSPVPFVVARLRLGRRAPVRFRDFRTCIPEDDTCYVAYLSPGGMRGLRTLFEQRLPRRVRLVSAVFAVRGWTPQRSIRVPDMHRNRVFVYEVLPDNRD